MAISCRDASCITNNNNKVSWQGSVSVDDPGFDWTIALALSGPGELPYHLRMGCQCEVGRMFLQLASNRRQTTTIEVRK